MNNNIKVLIQQLKRTPIDRSMLENISFNIIENDSHHELPDNIQQIIYEVNMVDINKLQQSDYDEFASILENYLLTD